jgi:hypothetical protein
VRDRLRVVASQRLDRPRVPQHRPAEPLVSAATDVGVAEDLAQRSTETMLSHDVGAEAGLAEGTRPELEEGIGVQPAQERMNRITIIIAGTAARETSNPPGGSVRT